MKNVLQLPRIGLGTAPLGGLYAPVPPVEAMAVLERAWEMDIRYFDTAPLYGNGLAEQRLGSLIQRHARQDLLVSTKVGRRIERTRRGDDESMYHGNAGTAVFDFGFDAASNGLHKSLDRLGLEYVDIALVHDPDDYYDAARTEAFAALRELRSAGVVRAIGFGMNNASMLARLAEDVAPDVILVANRYTLLDQGAAEVLLPTCERRGIPVIVGGVYNSGVLADPDGPQTHFDYGPASAEIIERARRLREVCRQFGVPLQAAAVQFPLRHPAVTTVLLSARTVAELETNATMSQIAIPDELWRALDTVARGASSREAGAAHAH